MTDDTTIPDDEDITLRDVIMHMQLHFSRLHDKIDGVEKRLEKKIDANRVAIDANRVAIDANHIAIQDVKTSLTVRIDALEEDLTATIKDTIKIRRHVGLPVGEA